jgi:hypothetical protein
MRLFGGTLSRFGGSGSACLPGAFRRARAHAGWCNRTGQDPVIIRLIKCRQRTGRGNHFLSLTKVNQVA